MSANNRWFDIKAQAKKDENSPACEAFIYDDIGAWGITASDFIAALKPYAGQKILVRINSRGGDVWQGLAIYSYLKGQNADTHVDGIAASMASIVALAGRSVSMSENAFFMVHNPAGGVVGTADQIEEYADFLRKVQGTLASAYQRETGATPDLVQKWMDGETWFSAEEAKAAGLADTITEGVAFSASVGQFKNPPRGLGAIDCKSTPRKSEKIDEPEMSTPAPTPSEKSFAESLRNFLGLGSTTQPTAEAPELVQARADLVTARASVTSLGEQVKALAGEVSTLKASLDKANADLTAAKAAADAAKKEADAKAAQRAAVITAAQGQPALDVKPNDPKASGAKGNLTEQCLAAKATTITK